MAARSLEVELIHDSSKWSQIRASLSGPLKFDQARNLMRRSGIEFGRLYGSLQPLRVRDAVDADNALSGYSFLKPAEQWRNPAIPVLANTQPDHRVATHKRTRGSHSTRPGGGPAVVLYGQAADFTLRAAGLAARHRAPASQAERFAFAFGLFYGFHQPDYTLFTIRTQPNQPLTTQCAELMHGSRAIRLSCRPRSREPQPSAPLRASPRPSSRRRR